MPTTPAAQPDNRPVALFTDQRAFIIAVFHELNRRLSPAVLADDPVNGSLLFQQITERNPQTVGDLADWLEAAVKKIVFDGRLIWKVPPKTLVGPNRPEKPTSAAESEAEFAKWQKDAEGKQKYDAEQSAAEKRIVGRINSYSPTKLGRLDYAAQEKFQTKWRAELEKAKKKGSDLCKLEREMAQ